MTTLATTSSICRLPPAVLSTIFLFWTNLVSNGFAGQGNLQIVARTDVNGLTSIGTGVSINNLGTIAFSATLSDGKGAVFLQFPDGHIKQLVGAGRVNDYGLQINDENKVIFVNQGLMEGICLIDPGFPGMGCVSRLDTSAWLYGVYVADPAKESLLLAYSSWATYYNPWSILPRGGPFVSLMSSATINNYGHVAFVGDISTTSAETEYRIGMAKDTVLTGTTRAEMMSRPLLADNGNVVFKDDSLWAYPVTVWNGTQSRALADTNSFEWTGKYPGITDTGTFVVYTGKVRSSAPNLPAGEGLFLSQFEYGTWTNRKVLGLNTQGDYALSGFSSYYRSCAAEVANHPHAVQICFAASVNQRIGVYSVVYDYRRQLLSPIDRVLEVGADLWCADASGVPIKLGRPLSFEISDSINTRGEIAVWVQTDQCTAVIRKPTFLCPVNRFSQGGDMNNGVPEYFGFDKTNHEVTVSDEPSGTFRSRSHKLLVGDRVRFSLSPAGAALPSALNGALQYYVNRVSGYDFCVSETSAGPALKGVKPVRNLRFETDPTNAHPKWPSVTRVSGCVLTSLASLASSLGRDTTPHSLDNLFRLLRTFEQGGVYSGPLTSEPVRINDIHLERAASAMNLGFHRVSVSNSDVSASLSDALVGTLNRAIVRLPAHSVVVVGRISDTDWYVHDPGNRTNRTLSQVLQAHKYNVTEIQVFTPPASANSVTADADCPIELMLTDSSGVRVGFDAVSQSKVIEVDGGYYSKRYVSIPPDEIDGIPEDRDGSKSAHFPRPVGPILVDCIGVGDGPYDLVLNIAGPGGGSFTSHFSGTASNGITTSHIIDIPTAGSSDLSLSTVSPLTLCNVGDELVLMFSITNGGPDLARSVTFNAICEGGVKLRECTSPDISLTNSDVSAVGFLPALAADGRIALTMHLDVVSADFSSIRVWSHGYEHDANLVDNEWEIEVPIVRALQEAILTNLDLAPGHIELSSSSPTMQVTVRGLYDDGTIRPIAGDELGLRFVCIDPSVATVTTNGLVEARAPGNTTLWVRSGPLAVSAPVRVLGMPFTNAPPRDQQLEVVDLGGLPETQSLVDLNNAGQVLLLRLNSGYALWQDGKFTPLSPSTASFLALSDSGLISGGQQRPSIWHSPSNFTELTFNDGSLLPPQTMFGGYRIADFQDSDSGPIGIVVQNSVGMFGGVSFSSWRFAGHRLAPAPIAPQGTIPSGFSFSSAGRINSKGTVIAGLVKVRGEELVGRLSAVLDADDNLTLLPWDGPMPDYVDATALNDHGDIVGSIRSSRSSAYGPAVLWRNGSITTLWSGLGATATAINNRRHIALRGVAAHDSAIWANGEVVMLTDLLGPDYPSFGEILALNDQGWLICYAGHRTLGGRYVLIKLGPAIRYHPVSRTKVPGQSVVFSALGYGVEPTYQWRKDGTNLVDGPRISGSTTTQLTVSDLGLADAGRYDVVLTDAYGSVTSSNAALTVIDGPCLPAPSGLVAQWTGDGTAQEALNRWNARLVHGGSFTNGLSGMAFAFDGLTNYAATELDVGPSAMPSTTWEAWIYTLGGYPDKAQVIFDGGGGRALYLLNGEFTVLTGDSLLFWRPARVVPNQWWHVAVVFSPTNIELHLNTQRYVYGRGSNNVGGAATFTFGRSFYGGGYSGVPGGCFHGFMDEVTVYDRALSSAEIQTIYDVGAAGKCRPEAPPEIISQPVGQPVYTGFDAPFAVTAVGSAAIGYQWYHNGIPIPGATERRFTVTNTGPANAGNYTVVATNGYGVVTSALAALDVRGACENQWTLVDRSVWYTIGMTATFDSARGVVVMFNGDTWEWNGAEWRLAVPVGTQTPSSRSYASMAYDSARGVCVLFGGRNWTSALNDTWEYDGTKWTLASAHNPALNPIPRSQHAMVYDSNRGVVVLFGGDPGNSQRPLGDTWEWDGIEWTRVGQPGCPAPAPRNFHAMAYDAAGRRAILYGGDLYPGLAQDTWSWDGSCWRQIDVIQAPGPRSFHSMAYHSGRESVVLFGGHADYAAVHDTWELVGDSWVQVPASVPGHRWPQLAYDSIRNVMVQVSVYRDPNGEYSDTWEWRTPSAPVFVQQPVGGRFFVGEPVLVNSCTVGAGTLAYQWQSGDGLIPGQDRMALQFDAVQAAQAGSYSLVASNAHGVVTSAVARLTVLPCQPTQPGLVSWWRAEGDAKDAAGTNQGTWVDESGYAVGKVGQAFRFNGSDSALRVPSSPSLNLSAAPGLTIEAWVNPNDLSARPLVEWNTGAGDNAAVGVSLWISSVAQPVPGGLVANLRQTNLTDHVLASGSDLLTTSEFQHVAMTYDRVQGVLTLFRNGAEVARQPVGTFRTATTADVYLGSRPGTTNTFKGLLDEVSIYSRALSAQEIASIYQAGGAGKCLEPDGTPYVYVNGVSGGGDVVGVPDGPPASIALLSTYAEGLIRYTLDGTSPTHGTLYNGPFALNKSAQLRAIADATNGTSSKELSVWVQILPIGSLPLRHLKLVSVAADRILVISRSEARRRSVLERSTDLQNWVSVASAVAAEDGTAHLQDTSPAPDQAFYRVLQE